MTPTIHEHIEQLWNRIKRLEETLVERVRALEEKLEAEKESLHRRFDSLTDELDGVAEGSDEKEPDVVDTNTLTTADNFHT